MRTRQTLIVGTDRFRVGPWQGSPDVAFVAVGVDPPRPSVAGLRGCLDQLADWGFTSVVTAALHPSEATAFELNGFDELDRLLVLSHDLLSLNPSRRTTPREVRLRWARPGDRDRAILIDHRAFESFWQLDRPGLRDAEVATPARRLRLASSGSHLVGYAVTGRAGRQGFLQRLAVDPDHHGRGIGSALVVDALRWADRHGVRRMLVNTQFHNERARALYEQLGFTTTSTHLVVLSRSLP
ncbi:MAG: GNAT family N-acetyltransferase [Actinomycetes bacterium]